MLFRYYPKQIKSLRQVSSEPVNKGKKHYWGLENGDYGFYGQEDKQQNSGKKRDSVLHHKRHKTQILNTYEKEREKLRQMGSKKEEGMRSTKKKTILSFNRNLNIKLPSVRKVETQVQTEEERIRKNINGRRIYTDLNESQSPERQRKYRNVGDLVRRQKEKRHDLSRQLEGLQKEKASSKLRNNKYSPTYVCSLKNPLPTYKHYPNDRYQIGYDYQGGDSSPIPTYF